MFDKKNKAQFQKDFDKTGVYFPIDVLSNDEVEYFRNSFFEQEALLGDKVTYSSFARLHHFFPWAYNLVMHPNILEPIKAILGPNVLVHGSTLFHKHPNDQKFVSWHQDSYNMKLNSFDYVSAWIALADSTVENGCLRVIPETHKSLFEHALVPTEHNILKRGTTVDVSSMKDKIQDVVLNAGQMSLHHVNTIHGSNANVSGVRRLGFAIRYIADTVSQRSHHHPLLIAAGKDNFGHYDIQHTVPEGTLSECIDRQRIAHKAYMDSLEESRRKNPELRSGL